MSYIKRIDNTEVKHLKRKVKIIKIILLIYIIFLILCLVILLLFHKSVEYKEDLSFQSVNMGGQERIPDCR